MFHKYFDFYQVLHNPKKQNVALVSSIVDFDLENDIVSVDLSGGK